jgi:hypothetical protein
MIADGILGVHVLALMIWRVIVPALCFLGLLYGCTWLKGVTR